MENIQNNVLSQTDKEEQEIEVKDIVLQLLNHWKLILLCALICAAGVFAYCRFMVTPQYASTSALYVFSKSTSVTSLADLQIGSNLTTDYETIITSRPVLDRVITRMELKEDYQSLKGKISVTNPSDSRILYITCTDPDPKKAKDIADKTASVASTFISQKMDQDPPSIIQAGYSDGEPVSPRPKKMTVLGALLSALAVSVFITLMYLISNTIDTPEDIQEKLGLEVLASLPYEESAEKKMASRKKRRTRGIR